MRTVTKIWNHTVPDNQEQDLQLLTIGGVSVIGRWAGELGEYFVGWCYPNHNPLLTYNPNINRNQDVQAVKASVQ